MSVVTSCLRQDSMENKPCGRLFPGRPSRNQCRPAIAAEITVPGKITAKDPARRVLVTIQTWTPAPTAFIPGRFFAVSSPLRRAHSGSDRLHVVVSRTNHHGPQEEHEKTNVASNSHQTDAPNIQLPVLQPRKVVRSDHVSYSAETLSFILARRFVVYSYVRRPDPSSSSSHVWKHGAHAITQFTRFASSVRYIRADAAPWRWKLFFFFWKLKLYPFIHM